MKCAITRLDRRFQDQIQTIIDDKTKPQGALGRLESCALQLALIQNQGNTCFNDTVHISAPTMLVFAGDHGIVEHDISIAPSAVTRQMVLNFISGGAAINCFCRTNGINLKVIDAGIIEPITDNQAGEAIFISQRLGASTRDFSSQPAMTNIQVEQGLLLGKQVVEQTIKQGCNLLLLGEMGIGNTSSASAILAALTAHSVSHCVGLGTGIDALQLMKKKQLIERALARQFANAPLTVMAEVGGYEIVQMVGAILAASQAGIAILIDGFIVTSAALLACRMYPQTRDYLVFAHQSTEQAHLLMLAELEAEPLLDLGLRLGEGTGAALALPLLQASVDFYNDMASFTDAGVVL